MCSIFIHLFNFQKYETLYFSDISLFKNIKEKTKKRSQLKNLLVLICRILFLSSIILAFCFPYLPNLDKSEFQKIPRIGIYLDNSFSIIQFEIESSRVFGESLSDKTLPSLLNDSNDEYFLQKPYSFNILLQYDFTLFSKISLVPVLRQ